MRAAVTRQAGPVAQQSAIGLCNAIQGFKHGPRVSLSLPLSLSRSPPNPKPTSLDRRGEEEAFFAPPLPVLISCPVYSCPLGPLTGSGPRPARPSPPAPGPGPIGPQFFKFRDLYFTNLGIRVFGGAISHFW